MRVVKEREDTLFRIFISTSRICKSFLSLHIDPYYHVWQRTVTQYDYFEICHDAYVGETGTH